MSIVLQIHYASGPDGMAKEINTLAEKIRTLLSSELPGEKAHMKMIPEFRKVLPRKNYDRHAAVLILIHPDAHEIRISFIKRAEYGGVHSGQISFPGGMREDQDRDLSSTALRETAEETGIKASSMQILGKLSPIYIPVSAFRVQPFVACTDRIPAFRPDPKEVDFMINIPIAHLLDANSRKKEKWNLSGVEAEVPFFLYDSYKIWGATAMILSEFLELIEEIEPDLWTLECSDNDCNDT